MGQNCCCFCCLDEGAKVGRILEKFNAVPARQAQPGALNKVVGRVVLAGQQPFYVRLTTLLFCTHQNSIDR